MSSSSEKKKSTKGILKKYKEHKKSQISIQFDEQNLQENEEIKKIIKENCTTINEAKTPFRYAQDSDSEGECDPHVPRLMSPMEHMDRITSALERKLAVHPSSSTISDHYKMDDECVNEHSHEEISFEHSSMPISKHVHISDDEMFDDEYQQHSPSKHIGFSLEHPMFNPKERPEGDHEHESPEFKRKRKEHYNEYLVMKKMKERNQKYFENGQESDEETSSDDDE
ncbi:hypothetical protein C9374_008437 [Naegleria lovaniensis]|uniref:Protein phosphatase inhibitor 2 n=1 Tax=Naegleria lovaniensis TaxID=51637 RepID=A0AA88GF92_NAELO|nr:uncharacterized protein C9374_008437 [Naegleria lovaniensis]KAG2378294.1 hypothetical protein C9374_008437 [Naegleria lovaniensis]